MDKQIKESTGFLHAEDQLRLTTGMETGRGFEDRRTLTLLIRLAAHILQLKNGHRHNCQAMMHSSDLPEACLATSSTNPGCWGQKEKGGGGRRSALSDTCNRQGKGRSDAHLCFLDRSG